MKTIICLIFALLLSGCDTRTEAIKAYDKAQAERAIKRAEEVKLYGTFDGNHISKVEFQKHDYYLIESQTTHGYIVSVPVHDPDCKKCSAQSK